jgi:hypothetical protein
MGIITGVPHLVQGMKVNGCASPGRKSVVPQPAQATIRNCEGEA